MPFRKHAAPLPVPASPEALYPVLSHGPNAPRELWSRQADVPRAYDGLKNKEGEFPADVAIELPTGAGKTLVGFLIAEWRRRKWGEPVAYVAPTRQLAQQAAALGRLYGIPAVDLTGSHIRWDRSEEIRFRQGGAVAVAVWAPLMWPALAVPAGVAGPGCRGVSELGLELAGLLAGDQELGGVTMGVECVRRDHRAGQAPVLPSLPQAAGAKPDEKGAKLV